jgi:two-component system response regulator MprA
MTIAPPRRTILVIEDRPEVLALIVRTLEDGDHEIVTAVDGCDGLTLALERLPDLIVLDLTLPGDDGLAITRTLRERGFRAPILMLTGRGALTDRVDGLDAGGDDYLVKPFAPEELLARTRALLRRAALRDDAVQLRVGDLVLDPAARRVMRAGEPITLTLKEAALLELLMRHAGQTVSREQAMQTIWRSELDTTTNIVDVYVNYLRRKLDGDGVRAGTPSRIVTRRGVGYELRLP